MKLASRLVEKPWGRTSLPAPFRSTGQSLGELWFEPPKHADSLLIKYIFTSERLSVQVHPSDAQAQAFGLPRGKEECWFVLDAEPDARLGIGLLDTLTPDALRAAVESGAIEEMIDWKPVSAGDFFYIPAGTIHAIGAGIVLVEVQQNSDITYRLYDYGRPRELHLAEGMAVSLPQPYADTRSCHMEAEHNGVLVNGPYFSVALCQDTPMRLPGIGPSFILPLSGSIALDGETAGPGDCLACDAPEHVVTLSPARMLVARAAACPPIHQAQGV